MGDDTKLEDDIHEAEEKLFALLKKEGKSGRHPALFLRDVRDAQES
ncbi:hypothetical protein L195_g017372 [Trifolium pratense]|uniref:Uncharacterized protein n=1 Tax=Trifolium pratense TaxID=57577 RepID=A0A2K3MTP4_TRIPR|nr:hypothetical protein L195_g017372 [Trifolium pratense]